jgi:predicted RNA polymerase sigma factor
MELTAAAYKSALARLARAAPRPDAEDALQSAAAEWLLLPRQPDNPAGWLVRRGRQRLADARRHPWTRLRGAPPRGAEEVSEADVSTETASLWLALRALDRAGALWAWRSAITSASRSARARARARVRATLELSSC